MDIQWLFDPRCLRMLKEYRYWFDITKDGLSFAYVGTSGPGGILKPEYRHVHWSYGRDKEETKDFTDSFHIPYEPHAAWVLQQARWWMRHDCHITEDKAGAWWAHWIKENAWSQFDSEPDALLYAFARLHPEEGQVYEQPESLATPDTGSKR